MLQYRHSSGLLQSFSPARQRNHDGGHDPLFSFAGLPALLEARMRRCTRQISQAEGSAWLSPPFGLIPSWNGVKPTPCLPVKTDRKHYNTVFCFEQVDLFFLIIQKLPLHRAKEVFEWREVQKPQVSGRARDSVPHVSIYRLCTRSARIALSTASTITPTSAKIAAHMFAIPSAPSARQANLITSANTMF